MRWTPPPELPEDFVRKAHEQMAQGGGDLRAELACLEAMVASQLIDA